MGQGAPAVRYAMRSWSLAAARPEHLPALPHIEREAATLFPPASFPPGFAERTVDDALLQAAQRDGRLWVAIDDASGEPVGFALVMVVDGTAFLAEVDVLPSHGRRGIGRALVERAIAWTIEHGWPHLMLTTFAHLPWNAAFYRGLGFEPMAQGDLPEPVRAALAHEVAMGLERRIALRRVLAEKPVPVRGGVTDGRVPLPEHLCPVCGAANRCAPAASGTFDVPCWCTQAAISPAALARVPQDLRGKACLCPACAGVAAGKTQ